MKIRRPSACLPAFPSEKLNPVFAGVC
uniref:Uncharacterized protein n=1 Tax=Anguilla anguilla TaxID=7936 RepID=A0A0E9UMI8_ANGAN